MGFVGSEAEEGKAAFRSEAGEYLYNPIGVVHGGFAMTLLDSAWGCAVHTTLARGKWDWRRR
jgi:acyl-coenzyme A thioesterase PaaI-like protein